MIPGQGGIKKFPAPLLKPACLLLSCILLESFLYYQFSSTVPYLNLPFSSIWTCERDKIGF